MVDIKDIDVSSEYGISRLIVSFKTSDSLIDLSKYRFDVYRSDYSSDGFVLVGFDINTDTFIDETVNLVDRTKHYYYKIGVTDRETGDFALSDITGHTDKHRCDVWGSAIIDIESLWLEHTIDNDEIWLLKQRSGGELCSCYDDIRKVADPRCPYCMGTKYVGGFYPAQPIKVNYQNSTTISEGFDQQGISEEVTPISFWMPNLPRVFPNDIVIGQNDVRYIINSVNTTYKNHYVIRQIVMATPIPKSDRRYKISLNGGMSDG